MYREGCIHKMWKGSPSPDAMLRAWLQQITLLMLIELLTVQAISACLQMCGSAGFVLKHKEQTEINRYSSYEMNACLHTSPVHLDFLTNPPFIFSHLLSSSFKRSHAWAWPIRGDKLKRLRKRCLHLICTNYISAAFMSCSLIVPAERLAHFELWAIIALWWTTVFEREEVSYN